MLYGIYIGYQQTAHQFKQAPSISISQNPSILICVAVLCEVMWVFLIAGITGNP
jgi:hypothetical protein